MQPREFRRRIGPQLVGEDAPHLLVHGERLRGPPVRVEGAHQLTVEAFAQRMGGDQLPQLGDEAATRAEREFRLDTGLRGGEPDLVETAAEGGRQVGEGGTAPETERLPEEGGCLGRIPGREGTLALGGQPLEAVHVHVVRADGQPVARRSGLDVEGEPLAQP